MTEERLKEIKDSIDFQVMIGTIKGHTLDVIKEEIELYNEVVRLREIIKEASDKVSAYTLIKAYYDYTEDDYAEIAEHDSLQEELLDILNKSNLTLEQLIGVENE